ncbi:MAG: hypothetical protein J6I52_03220 [Prevotella sp.]|nr:hypothetical protein [Prevotella sp.]MBP3842435.1 hypothetical protein [Prevotella sp.]
MRRTTSIIVVLLTLCCHAGLAQESLESIMSDYQITGCRYWFDNAPTVVQADFQSGQLTLNVAALEEGFHTLHYQVVDDKGGVSPARTVPFFRIQAEDEEFKEYTIKNVRYWFDKDYTPREVAYVGGTSAIDVSALEEGFHTMHYQVIDSKGESSPSHTVSFYRIPSENEQFKDYTIAKVRYWFDKDYTPREVAYVGGTSAIDVSALEEGFHTMHYQVIDSKGEASPSRTSPFFRVQPVEEQFKDYAVKNVRFWFDNDVSTMRTEAYDVNTTTLNLSYLPEGIHHLCYQVVTDDGQVSPVRSIDIDRWMYDIYVSRWTEYGDSIAAHNPLFATRPDLKLHYLPDDTNVRGHLTVDEGTTLSLGKFVQTANWGNKNDGNKYAKAGAEYYHPTTLLNNGLMRADTVIVKQNLYRDRWHFLSLPFNANVSDIGTSDGTYYALRAYDGEARSLGEMTDTWLNLGKEDKMEAGRGYIVQLTRENSDKTAELTFKSVNDPQKNNIFTTADVATILHEHQAEFAHNRSWNLVGNPYPSFYDSRSMDHDGTIIVWNGNGYTAYSLVDDSYILMPFEAFFIQKPLNADVLNFAKQGRQHTHEVMPRAESPRRATMARQNRYVLNFMLTDGTDTDRSRVVINEQATMGYDTEKDAPKFMECRPQMTQLFSVESGVQYAINERPMGDGVVAFSIFAPTDGEYRFSVTGDADNIVVIDAESGAVWAMADGDYVFTATEGMHHARLMVSLTGETTAIAQVNAYNDGEIKVADGQLSFNFMRTKHIKVFGLDGRIIFNDAVSHADVKVSRGVYLVEMDGKTTKMMVK